MKGDDCEVWIVQEVDKADKPTVLHVCHCEKDGRDVVARVNQYGRWCRAWRM